MSALLFRSHDREWFAQAEWLLGEKALHPPFRTDACRGDVPCVQITRCWATLGQ